MVMGMPMLVTIGSFAMHVLSGAIIGIVVVSAVIGLLFTTRGTAVRHVRGVGPDALSLAPDEQNFPVVLALLTGASILAGNSVELVLDGDVWVVKNRSHIRGVVIDSRIAWTGGFGFDDKWLGEGRVGTGWRDTSVRFEGPAVLQLVGAFAASWSERQGGSTQGTPRRQDNMRGWPRPTYSDGCARLSPSSTWTV